MKKRDNKSQKGVISIFVMVSMLFFLSTIVGVYMIASRRQQTQTEFVEIAQNQYYKEEEGEETTENKIYNERIASTGSIPIYTKEQLKAAGTNKIVEIEGKIYKCAPGESYQLKNDIVIDLKSLSETPFNTSINLTKAPYEIYYYFDENYYTSNGNDYQSVSEF